MQFTLKHTGTYLAAASAGLMLLGSATAANADHHNKPTITEIVLSSGNGFDNNRNDFDMLLAALVAVSDNTDTDLVSALNDKAGDFTVFAPRDGAFIRLAQDLGYSGHDEAGSLAKILEVLTAIDGSDPLPLLTTVLTYHVVGESLNRRQVARSDSIMPLSGGTIATLGRTLLDADPDFQNPRILRKSSNIRASNGIIHTIDRVLIPADLPNTPADAKSIAGIVASSGDKFDRNWLDYDILLAAVKAADPAVLETLSAANEDGLTVFAPNDAAFIRLARSLGYRGFRESGAFSFIANAVTDLGGGSLNPTLTNILLYHLSPGTQVLKDVILAESIVTALPGATIEPDGLRLQDNAPALRDPRLSVFFNEIRASNGIIHSINRVLIPVPVGG